MNWITYPSRHSGAEAESDTEPYSRQPLRYLS